MDDGNLKWKDAVSEGYTDWVSVSEYQLLKKCFQKRHLLSHTDGVVDQNYISKSGDTSYSVGQHIIIKPDEVKEYATIIEKIGEKVLSFERHEV